MCNWTSYLMCNELMKCQEMSSWFGRTDSFDMERWDQVFQGSTGRSVGQVGGCLNQATGVLEEFRSCWNLECLLWSSYSSIKLKNSLTVVKIAFIAVFLPHKGRYTPGASRKCKLFGREMFGSKLFTPAATWICDTNTGIRICERVLTAHSKEGKVGSHVTKTILKHSRKHSRTYQPSNRKYWVKYDTKHHRH